MLNIITIGSATKDIFLDASKSKKGQGFYFPLGGKIELENIKTFIGGGGVNTAITFSQQGLKTGFCGVVGQDLAGQTILDELNEAGIETTLAKVKNNRQTDLGIIFHAKSERTILLHHDASRSFNENDVDWPTLKDTSWLYLAPLWSKTTGLTLKIIDFAEKNKIKIAINPSQEQLALSAFKKTIGKIDVLLLNNDEASFLTGIKPYNEKAIFSSIYSCARLSLTQDKRLITVITKGKEGAICFDGKYLYKISAPPVKVVDATGAGDSFGSGFVAGLMQKKNIESSLQLAMANAISNIQVFGANKGLLSKNSKLPEIKIIKIKND